MDQPSAAPLPPLRLSCACVALAAPCCFGLSEPFCPPAHGHRAEGNATNETRLPQSESNLLPNTQRLRLHAQHRFLVPLRKATWPKYAKVKHRWLGTARPGAGLRQHETRCGAAILKALHIDMLVCKLKPRRAEMRFSSWVRCVCAFTCCGAL